MAVCYRHPNRETNVACANCGRPICPDCMAPTPVGMRCPECAGQRTRVRRGPAAFAPTGAPVATYALIAINVAVFVVELAGGGATSLSGGGKVIGDYGLLAGPIANQGEWYRIVTAGFLHAGIIHIAFNMYALYILGSFLEPAIGTPRFLGIYFVSLLTGSLGVILLSPDTLTVGASGAIFGLFAAALLVARGRGLEHVAGQLAILLAFNLLFTFSIPGISIGGHLGGIAGGVLAGAAVVAGERGILGSARIPAEIATMAMIAAVSAVGAVALA
jgi:membrane associated rhomboid family serine protease